MRQLALKAVGGIGRTGRRQPHARDLRQLFVQFGQHVSAEHLFRGRAIEVDPLNPPVIGEKRCKVVGDDAGLVDIRVKTAAPRTDLEHIPDGHPLLQQTLAASRIGGLPLTVRRRIR